MDSRVSPELVFDQRLGDIFAVRIAGNFVNTDILGSLEYATAVAGAKLIVVLGHSDCGAVKGAMYNYAPAGPDILERVRKIEAVCARHHVPLPAAALQFPLGHPIVASIIPGAISRANVEKNVAAFRHPIPADLWAELKHEKLIRADAPVPV